MKLHLVVVFSFLLLLPIAYAIQQQGTQQIVTTDNENLEKGWNLISSPVEGGYSVSFIKEKCTVQSGPWVWDTVDQEYTKVSKILPAKGSWIKVADDCRYDVLGTQITSFEELQLEKGWNLVSLFGDIDNITGTCSITSGPWWWNIDKQKYTEASHLNPVFGYWIKVKDDCILSKQTTPHLDLLPDLVPTQIIVRPTPPFAPGTKFTVDVYIENHGLLGVRSGDFYTTLNLAGDLLWRLSGSDYVIEQDKHLLYSPGTQFQIDQAGIYRLEVFVDADKQIEEKNETNNKLSIELTVA
jgi:hypothetical protein